MICDHLTGAFKLRFFENAEYKNRDYREPLWCFHIEEICANCGRHKKFVKQTKELIEELNGRLLIENFLDVREVPLKIIEEQNS